MKHILLIIFGGMLLVQSCTNKPIQLFTLKEVQTSKDVTLLDIDEKQLSNLRVDNSESVEIVVPFAGKTVTLELKQQELFTPDFRIMTDRGQASFSPGIYYEGVIKDNPNSLVTLNIQSNGVTGIISTSEGDINIGRQDNSYFMAEAAAEQFTCETQETNKTVDSLRALIEAEPQAAGGNCVTIDFELAHSIYLQFGGNTAAATNWFNGLFAGVRSIYLRENLDVKIKMIYLWTTPDGYSTSASTALSQLVAKRANDAAFTANLTHLVRGQSSGLSGIAYLGTVCVKSHRFAFSAVTFNFSTAPEGTLPPYSWSIMVVTHETGHNLNSPHTHSCSWPGGPIDDCTTQEGSCAPGPRPALGKGTIMSYCHQLSTVGINFANGFGPLPGAKIREGVAACSNCVVTPPTPTCSDGIKNGTETGIDCGGNCAPCPVVPTCSDGIKNQNETGIDCGGVCPACPPPPPTGDPLISLNKPIKQSTNYNTANSYPATKANDGMTAGANFHHTTSELQPWIEIDLNGSYKVSKITVTNRFDCCGNRLKRFKVFVSTTPITSYSSLGHVYLYNVSTGLANGGVLTIPLTVSGRYVKVWMDNTGYGNWPLHLSEISVQGIPAAVEYFRDSLGKVTHDTMYRVKCIPPSTPCQ